MKPVFADTHYYIAITNPRDDAHVKAREFGEGYRGVIVTTEYVLIEFGNYMSRTGDRAVFREFMFALESDPLTTIVPVSSQLLRKGLQLHFARVDKEWSVTDCTSFIVMQEFDLADALTGDRHFGQAGYTALLSSDQ